MARSEGGSREELEHLRFPIGRLHADTALSSATPEELIADVVVHHLPMHGTADILSHT